MNQVAENLNAKSIHYYKFFIPLSIICAILYWFGESLFHWKVLGQTFQVVPSDFNELMMRATISLLIECIGFIVTYYEHKAFKSLIEEF